MKYLSLILIVLSICLSACNNNDEPIANVSIPIDESFIPVSEIYETCDTDFRNEITDWVNKKVIVNSSEDLPQDPLGFPESYSKIDYSNHTLLLYYDVHTYDVVAYESQMIKNSTEQLYDWIIRLGISGDLNNSDEIVKLAFTRYGILIPKTPVTTSDLRVSFNVTNINSDLG